MEVNTNGGAERWSPAGVSALNWMMLISLVDISSPSRLSECHLLLPILPHSLFVTLGFLPDPESPLSSGCFNKFIRVKLTHWIKSDRAESCSAAGPFCNSAVQILHLLSLALVQPRLHLQGFLFCCLVAHPALQRLKRPNKSGRSSRGRSRAELSVGLSVYPRHGSVQWEAMFSSVQFLTFKSQRRFPCLNSAWTVCS